MELKEYKCGGCNTLRKKSDFIYKEKVNKTCSKCMETRKAKAEYQKQYNKQYHNKNKAELVEKQKHYKYQRKQDNPLNVKIENMIYTSKSNDKKYNRIYEEADYIDYNFLLGLWETQTGLCGYELCKCEMVLTFNYESRNPQQITIERLDNNIAHIKTNVILSCFECNVIKRMETKL
tara:strand:- start:33 stop:563 length:531 start_codon:yes stop_codon:yes gene_type:complete